MINEIEYRLEQSPPVVEDPEDDVFEEVVIGSEVCYRKEFKQKLSVEAILMVLDTLLFV